MIELLPVLYPKFQSHFDMICTEESIAREQNLKVKKLTLQLMVQRVIYVTKQGT